jgi:hypothetical protein
MVQLSGGGWEGKEGSVRKSKFWENNFIFEIILSDQHVKYDYSSVCIYTHTILITYYVLINFEKVKLSFFRIKSIDFNLSTCPLENYKGYLS